MVEQTINLEDKNSIEVSRTSKGLYSFSIKRYYSDEKPEEIIKVLNSIMELLKKQFR